MATRTKWFLSVCLLRLPVSGLGILVAEIWPTFSLRGFETCQTKPSRGKILRLRAATWIIRLDNACFIIWMEILKHSNQYFSNSYLGKGLVIYCGSRASRSAVLVKAIHHKTWISLKKLIAFIEVEQHSCLVLGSQTKVLFLDEEYKKSVNVYLEPDSKWFI